MKNKGFTLVELLAVIAIMAILVIMTLPNILGSFSDSKKKNFVTEAREIYKAAKNQHVLDRAKGLGSVYENNTPYSSLYPSAGKLDVGNREGFGYFVYFNNSENIVYVYVCDNDFSITLGEFDSESNTKVESNDFNVSAVEDYKPLEL